MRHEPSDDDETVEAMPALLASLGRKLRAAREHAGLSQRELFGHRRLGGEMRETTLAGG